MLSPLFPQQETKGTLLEAPAVSCQGLQPTDGFLLIIEKREAVSLLHLVLAHLFS